MNITRVNKKNVQQEVLSQGKNNTAFSDPTLPLSVYVCKTHTRHFFVC